MPSIIPNGGEPLQHVRNYLGQVEKLVSVIEIFPRDVRVSAYDSIALQIISKSFALARAVTLLIDNGLPDEGYGLSRSLVECAATLRYITAEPSLQDQRTHEFISYSEVEQRYWLEQARQHISDPIMLKEVEKVAAAEQLDTRHRKPLAALAHW